MPTWLHFHTLKDRASTQSDPPRFDSRNTPTNAL
jgi:hypothetical protein